MTYRSNPTLSKEEAIQLHNESLVIDSQQPPITSGALFTDNMRKSLDEWFKEGMTRAEARGLLSNMMADEIQNSQDAKNQYIEMWDKSFLMIVDTMSFCSAKKIAVAITAFTKNHFVKVVILFNSNVVLFVLCLFLPSTIFGN